MKSFKQYIKESGNAVTNITRINQENVKATLEKIHSKLLSALNIDKKNTNVLGSTGKKKPGGSSGDIDMAIDANVILSNNNITDVNKLYPFIEKIAKKFSNEVDNRGASLGIVSLRWPISNTDKKQKNQFVQLDLMVMEDINFAKWIFWSPSEEESKWKGVHRNMLLTSIANNINFKIIKTALDKQGKEVPVEFEKMFFDLRKGLFRGLQTKQGKKGILKNNKTISRKFISSNPSEIVQLLLGPKFNIQDTNSFESVLAVVNNKNFLYKDKRKEILSSTAKKIDNLNIIFPEELKRYL